MRNSAFFLTGMVLLIVETQLFRFTRIVLDVFGFFLRVVHLRTAPLDVPGLVPSLVLPLILFMGIHEFPLALGACVVFALGYMTDILSVAPVGLHAFTFVATFVLARSASVRLAAQTKMMQALMATGFAIVHSVMILVLIAIFGTDAFVPRAVWTLMWPHVIATGVIAPFIFVIAQRVYNATATSTAKRENAGGEAS